jgi:hypothetical protein
MYSGNTSFDLQQNQSVIYLSIAINNNASKIQSSEAEKRKGS